MKVEPNVKKLDLNKHRVINYIDVLTLISVR